MDKKAKIKSGLIFGIAMTVFYIIQGLLTQDNLTTRNIVITIVSSLIGGAFSGFLFGWMMGLVANSKFLTKGIHIETDVNETIVFQTGANHFKGVESVGGKLYLTDKRLVFKSHRLNIQNHELSIPLSDIENVDRYKALGISNNGLIVETINHTIEKFVVQQPGEWIEHLLEKNGSQNFAIQ